MAELVYAGGVDLYPIPPFEEKVISEDSEYIIATTTMGTTVKRDKKAPTTFYGHLDYPIKTRADWQRYKERLDPFSPERLAQILDPENVRKLNASDNPVGLCF
ncbi:MAG: hypothetical protein GXO74_08325, partial [Calditrichaeota bacterium]|nr:hypothetical protein [Calditrichota bacterium]